MYLRWSSINIALDYIGDQKRNIGERDAMETEKDIKKCKNKRKILEQTDINR